MDTAVSMVRELLETVKEASDSFAPLKTALGLFLKVWDVYDVRQSIGTISVPNARCSAPSMLAMISSNSQANYRRSTQSSRTTKTSAIPAYRSGSRQLLRACQQKVAYIVRSLTQMQRHQPPRRGRHGEAEPGCTQPGISVNGRCDVRQTHVSSCDLFA